MKHEFTVTSDINRRAGDVLITAKTGETVTLSDRESAIAASFEELEYAGVAPETPLEAEFAQKLEAQGETKEDLMRLKRDELIERATALGIPVNSDTKEELATAILAAKPENQLKTESADFDTKESE